MACIGRSILPTVNGRKLTVPSNLILIDTETDGVDPSVNRVIEIGAILFSVKNACVISAWSELIRPDDVELNPPTNAAESANRIAPQALEGGVTYAEAIASLQLLSGRADAAVAHNAVFDHGFLGTVLDPLPWICSMDDIEWPRPGGSQALIAIALAHDVGVVQAHRALADCYILARLLERVHELRPGCLPAMLARAMRPKVLYQAMVSFEDKEKAKAVRFRWEPETRRWLRRMAPEDVADLDFPVRDVEVYEKKPRIRGERLGVWVQKVDGAADSDWWQFCDCAGPFPVSVMVSECLSCFTRGYQPSRSR